MRTFHLCTIANHTAQYSNMLASLKQAGFNEDNTRITLLDNFQSNTHEPYSAINLALGQTPEKYLLFCHQDLLFDKGDGYNQLVARLEQLTLMDPNWAVAGNAGVNEKYKYVIRISDANQSYNWTGNFPQKVFTLDENFLVFNLQNRTQCSPQLSGFHLYGSDLCLHAINAGFSCYVIDYHITHLSGGTMSDDFFRSLNQFYQHWRNSFRLCIHKTVTGRLKVMSDTEWIERLVTFKPVRKIVLFINKITPIVTPYRK